MFFVYTMAVTNVSLVFAICLTKGSFHTWKGAIIAEFVCVAITVVLPLVCTGIQVQHGMPGCDNLDLSLWNGDSVIFNGLILIMCSEILVVDFALCILF